MLEQNVMFRFHHSQDFLGAATQLETVEKHEVSEACHFGVPQMMKYDALRHYAFSILTNPPRV